MPYANKRALIFAKFSICIYIWVGCKWLKFTMSFILIQSFVVGINVAIQLLVGSYLFFFLSPILVISWTSFHSWCCLHMCDKHSTKQSTKTLFSASLLIRNFFPIRFLSPSLFFSDCDARIVVVVCHSSVNGASAKLSMMSQNYKIIVSIQVFTQWPSVFRGSYLVFMARLETMTKHDKIQ